MTTNSRQVAESPLVQGAGESIVYQITTTPWGSSPAAVTVKVYDITGGGSVDVSAASLLGAATVAGDVITLPAVRGLTAGHVYRLEASFTSGSHTFACWAEIYAEP